MNQQTNLKKAESKAFQMSFQDGLWDIFLGVMIGQFAIVPFLTDLGWGDFWSSMAMLPINLLCLFGIRKLKSSLIVPRLGLVTYKPARRRKISKVTLIAVATLILGVIFGLMVFFGGEFSEWFFPVLFSLIVLAAFLSAAYFLDWTRLILYGILIALAPVTGQVLYKTFGAVHHGFPITFGISGSLMIIIGLYLFFKFLQSYPLPDISGLEIE